MERLNVSEGREVRSASLLLLQRVVGVGLVVAARWGDWRAGATPRWLWPLMDATAQSMRRLDGCYCEWMWTLNRWEGSAGATA